MSRRVAREGRVGRHIRAEQVRVLDAAGQHVGVMGLSEALERAEDAGLELVEISGGDVPVCRICDRGKLAYEQSKAAREARAQGRGAREPSTREVKLRPQTGEGDYQTKLRHIRRFLSDGDRVRIVVMLRGRQIHRDGDADAILERLRSDLSDVAVIDGPHRAGRDVRMLASSAAASKGNEGGSNPV
jgi:translation initiation factor IF-3